MIHRQIKDLGPTEMWFGDEVVAGGAPARRYILELLYLTTIWTATSHTAEISNYLRDEVFEPELLRVLRGDRECQTTATTT